MSASEFLPTPLDIAEQAVIGSILIDQSVIDIVRGIISPDDFYSSCNQSIFGAMCHLEDIGKQIDSVSVLKELSDNKQFQNAGGIYYLTNCSDSLPSTNMIAQYASIVREQSLKRKLTQFSETVKSLAGKNVDDIDVEIARLSEEILKINASNGITPWVSFSKAMQEACYALVNDSGEECISSGFCDLDSKITGFRSGSLTIIAARPAMGKTALGLNIMQNVAFKSHLPVVFFSLEMTASELIYRTISCLSSVNGNAIRQKKLSDEEWNGVLGAAEMYKDAQIFIDETPAIEISTLQERAKRLHRQYGIKMIIVDYLQLMRSSSKKVQNREQEIADISKGLKEIAKTLHVPVIALAQLNRAVDARACKQPVLSDLRESGSIEQDADTVIFIHREDYYNPNSTPTNEAEIIIAKQRSGPTGIIKLHWEGQYTRFSNLEQDAQF